MTNLTDNHTARRIRMSYSAIVATLVLTLAALISFCMTNGKTLSVHPQDIQFVPVVNDSRTHASDVVSPGEPINH